MKSSEVGGNRCGKEADNPENSEPLCCPFGKRDHSRSNDGYGGEEETEKDCRTHVIVFSLRGAI